MSTAIKPKPIKLLSDLSVSKASGCLELKEDKESWKIYLEGGDLQYVHYSIQTLEQLKYHLRCLEFTSAIAALKTLPQTVVNIQNNSAAFNIYSKVISWLLSNETLKPNQSLQLIQSLSKENLKYAIWLKQANYQWHNNHTLPLWITTQIKSSLSPVNLSEFLSATNKNLSKWQDCSEKILSIYQRPYFAPGWKIKAIPDSGSLDIRALTELTKVLKGRTTIRQLSVLLKQDEFQVAKILSPYIDNKIIYLNHSAAPFNKLPNIPRSVKNTTQAFSSNIRGNTVKTWKIVCIDDSPTILREITRFLDQNRFKITTINDPVQAASKVFTVDPDLILLDITMPKINGYKLCSLLRSSGKCDLTPIIMVTGNTGLIDKARAKISGATDYLTKPFTKEGLNEIVNKHLSL